MAWTAPATYAVGQTMTAAAMNLIRDNLNSAYHANSGVAQPKIEAGTFTTTFTATTATTGTLNFTESFTTAPIVSLTVGIGGNLDICINFTATPSTTSVPWRAFQNIGSAVSGTATVHWVAVGT